MDNKVIQQYLLLRRSAILLTSKTYESFFTFPCPPLLVSQNRSHFFTADDFPFHLRQPKTCFSDSRPTVRQSSLQQQDFSLKQFMYTVQWSAGTSSRLPVDQSALIRMPINQGISNCEVSLMDLTRSVDNFYRSHRSLYVTYLLDGPRVLKAVSDHS